jgi:hypothetical protein
MEPPLLGPLKAASKYAQVMALRIPKDDRLRVWQVFLARPRIWLVRIHAVQLMVSVRRSRPGLEARRAGGDARACMGPTFGGICGVLGKAES